ncbi:hypothetical protein A2U01_0072198, partial [Trifolium medium]|nr:hypothetical protein [Trifolium medium]
RRNMMKNRTDPGARPRAGRKSTRRAPELMRWAQVTDQQCNFFAVSSFNPSNLNSLCTFLYSKLKNIE